MTTREQQLRNRIVAVLCTCMGLGFLWTLLPGRTVLAQGAPAKAAAQAKAPAISNPHGDIKIACETCHTAQSWTAMRVPSAFDHATTGFPLFGKHQNAACKACHASTIFTRVATGCADCHRDVHEGRNGQQCQECHTADRWANRSDAIRRHASTGFPLLGVHALLECSRCHGGSGESNIARVSSDCFSCHAAQYAAARSPNHVVSGFSTQCQQCHDASRTTWSGAGFDHAVTGFALTGAHRPLACTTCHTNGTHAGLSPECYACHQADFAGVQNPNHVASGFSHQCTSCHSTTTWAGASFDHATTGYPLTGAHRTTSCVQCHAGGRFAGTPTDCYACHQADFTAVQNPNHVASGFSTVCSTCHSTTAWAGASFDHATTGYPLTGAHRTTSCVQCHAGGRYAGTPTDCYACHQADFTAVQNPNHVASGFTHVCTTCHSTTSWAGASFDHATTGYTLTGAHRTTGCIQCHAGGRFAGTPTDCYACHQAQFQAAVDPNHVAAGFSTVCSTCHSTTAWAGATFDHTTTGFTLTGAHTTVSCTNCHTGGRYTGTPTDCYACHQAQYQATTNPNHAAAGFNTQCTTCHTTARWQGATFDHDTLFFRIYSGRHRNKWSSCTECHPNASSYQTFSCLSCHGQSETDSHHRGQSGYRYESTACYSCHRNV